MPRYTAFSILAVVALLRPSLVSAEELTAEELVAAMKASIRQISCIEATYRTYFQSLTAPGVIRGADGQGMFCEFQWGYDTKTGVEYLEGKWAVEENGRIYYDDSQIAYDGKVLTAANRRSNSGKILGERGDMFEPWCVPSVLWGRDFLVMPNRSIVEAMDGAELFYVKDTPEDLKVLRNVIKVGDESWHATVWIDTRHGFLPRRMEAAKAIFDIVMQRVEVDEISEIRPGLWLPLRGRVSRFAVTHETPGGPYPNGMTSEDVKRLSDEEFVKLVPALGYKQKALGYGTQTVLVDRKNLEINRPISAEHLTIDFPKGTLVWDDIKQRGYQVGRWDDPAGGGYHEAVREHSTVGYRRLMGWITGSLLLAVCGMLLWRRFRNGQDRR